MKSTRRLPSLLLTLGATVLAVALSAAPLSFDFKDPKGVNNAQFTLDAPLEIISGYATGVTGTVLFDPAAPEKTQGTIIIEAASLSVGNPVMLDHIRGKGWLNVEEFPEITFAIDGLTVTGKTGDRMTGTVKGTMTLRGVSQPMTIPVTLTYLPGRLGARINDESVKGDLLVVRSNFTIERADFGIRPGQNTEKVGETIDITLSIVGAYQG
jgi:polyisoprenoid-binding protein YceI